MVRKTSGRKIREGSLYSVDSDLVTTEQARIGSARKEVIDVVDFAEDTDGTTDLDLDVSVSVSDRTYEFELVFVLTTAPSSTGDLLVRFNSIFATKYDQTTVNGNDFDGGTELQSGLRDIINKKRFLLFAESRPNIREITLSHSTKSIDLGKSRAVRADQLNSIQLFTNGLACGGYAYIKEVSDQ